MPATPATQTPPHTNARLTHLVSGLLAGLGALLLLYGVFLAVENTLSNWGSSKAAGRIVRVVTAGASARSAPVVEFRDAAGSRHSFLDSGVMLPQRYAPGDAVGVLYDAEEPSRARIADYAQAFALPALFSSAGALLLLMAATLAGPPQRLRLRRGGALASDPSRLQFHPFNAVAVKHYLSEAGAPDARRKVKITDAASAIAEGRHPVALAEFLAYASALAYTEGGAQFLATHCPRIAKPAQFTFEGARALAFLFEEHAVIVLSDTKMTRTLAQVAALFTPRARPREYVPGEAVWDARPRERAAARTWAGLRDAIEAWVKDAAPSPHPDAEGEAAPRFIFSGHSVGGALAVLGAYEFAKRGRQIAAVVTFGGPGAGGASFAQDYSELGLDERTLDVRAPFEALPLLSWPLAAQIPATRIVLEVSQAKDGARAPDVARGAFMARLAHGMLVRAARRGARPSFPGRMALRALAASRSTRLAILRHGIERSYALALSDLIHARLYDLLLAGKGTGAAQAAHEALAGHLLDIRGVRPQDAHVAFATLDNLPAALPEREAATASA